jgi:hypothetical protein
MAEEELQAKLRELDHELEEGDITKKGCDRCPRHLSRASRD